MLCHLVDFHQIIFLIDSIGWREDSTDRHSNCGGFWPIWWWKWVSGFTSWYLYFVYFLLYFKPRKFWLPLIWRVITKRIPSFKHKKVAKHNKIMLTRLRVPPKHHVLIPNLISLFVDWTCLSLLCFPLAAQPPTADYDGLDFKLIVDSKSGPPMIITLVAPSHQDKAAWTSDISQVFR